MDHTELTVGDLVDLLSACDRTAPVRQAMNPFFPMAHRLAQVVQSVDETGQTVVYLAEGRDAGDAQLGHLPPDVAIELAWQSPVQAPPRRPRRTARGK
ncbi:hypothetical protein M8I34_20510 [Streptomyces sp. MCA2]|uniref:hypothetical protein n=1 Tax=Streptomyces sp. MCA2 TaxID=2944805 RepID=UPI002020DE6A|nr:hypothetical protein [Streptomyces sp. MCA2]MCL7493762.1 hypothetical protein [Streptomyces sp. MCA2]